MQNQVTESHCGLRILVAAPFIIRWGLWLRRLRDSCVWALPQDGADEPGWSRSRSDRWGGASEHCPYKH
jgi:hypothetical protein